MDRKAVGSIPMLLVEPELTYMAGLLGAVA